MGRHLGRLKDVRVEGEKVIGDLHFAQSAHATPEGDLAEYVMKLAEEDPAAAGLSIVFEHDQEAEQKFMTKFSGDSFMSPDEDNVRNLPHVRLAKLRAADIVDEPAANPEGLPRTLLRSRGVRSTDWGLRRCREPGHRPQGHRSKMRLRSEVGQHAIRTKHPPGVSRQRPPCP